MYEDMMEKLIKMYNENMKAKRKKDKRKHDVKNYRVKKALKLLIK